MAGPDETGWRPELEALANRLGVSTRIHWTGPLYGAAKWGALCGAVAFVLPSHQENFGIAVAEALGCGTPVLISNKVDIWREIETAGAGFVGPDTLEGTEVVLGKWLKMTETQKSQTAQAGQVLFRNKFDVAQTGPTLIDTIKGLL
jgi:glycosyltransferase involved in cell wall biosynthesis